MRNKIKYLCVILICILAHSCDEYKTTNFRIDLFTDIAESEIVDKKFNLDTISFCYSKDSIIMCMNTFNIPFFKRNGEIFELRDAYEGFTDYVRTDSILTFSTRDTTFVYMSVLDDFIPNALDYSIADCKYEIKKIGSNSYVTTKQSLVDTTFKEIYYYDKEYRITKFVNTYKGNICTYIPKK